MQYIWFLRRGFTLYIQRCENCSKEFRWKTVAKSIWTGYKPIVCDNCKTKHYPIFAYRFVFALSMGLPVFFIQFLSVFLKPYPLFILVYLIWISAAIAVSPFYFRYRRWYNMITANGKVFPWEGRMTVIRPLVLNKLS